MAGQTVGPLADAKAALTADSTVACWVETMAAPRAVHWAALSAVSSVDLTAAKWEHPMVESTAETRADWSAVNWDSMWAAQWVAHWAVSWAACWAGRSVAETAALRAGRTAVHWAGRSAPPKAAWWADPSVGSKAAS